jgi:hypothetical protein
MTSKTQVILAILICLKFAVPYQNRIDVVGIILKINKLSLVGMQLPEKYKKNFDVSSEGPS